MTLILRVLALCALALTLIGVSVLAETMSAMEQIPFTFIPLIPTLLFGIYTLAYIAWYGKAPSFQWFSLKRDKGRRK
jgi:hypothetical protein